MHASSSRRSARGLRPVRVAPVVVGSLVLFAVACSGSRPASTPTAATSAPAPPRPPGVALPLPVPTTASTRASLKLDSTWRTCHDLFVPDLRAAGPAAEAGRLAQLCAGATKMHRIVPAFTGEQSASTKPDTFHWKAQGGHCYRAYGVGGVDIKNLDLLMVDSLGAVLGQDGNDDGIPVLLDAGAVCFKQDDDAAVVVSVGDGKGPYAVEVWGD